MAKSKKLLILVFVLFLLTSFGSFAFAARKTEITYPTIPGAIAPTETRAILPEYVQYVFTFAITISAIIAFGSLLYGGFRWLVSAGSSSALSDAKSQMTAGVIGLAVILSSWVILNTINPQLVTINPGIEVKWGITLYMDEGCSSTDENRKKEITRDTVDLGGFAGYYLKFNDGVPAGSLDVVINDNSGSPFRSENTGCQSIGSSASSVKFIWKLPGVYLVKNDAQNTEKFLPASTATLDDFNNAVKGVKFNNVENSTNPSQSISYGAVLHEDQNWKGQCEVFELEDLDITSGSNPTTELNNTIGLRTSSVTTFPWSRDLGPGGVTFYTDDNFNGTPSSNFQRARVPNVTQSGVEIQDNSITSIKISGSYMAVLFEHANYAGKCQVFTKSDSNLRDDEIGRCECGLLGWGCKDCLSSFIILPTK